LALGDTPLFDHIAVIGLGTGTTAAFGRPGQTLDYYELDPNVVRMAKNPALYTYVTDSKAKVNIKLGDARLRMAEATPGTYGLIAVDAFSSDAIPIHLLTTEAFQMYMKALKPDGVLMVHSSNRFMQLGPVVGAICEKLDLKCARCLDSVADDDEERNWRQDKTSDWIMVTRSAATMDAVTKDVLAWEPVETKESIRAWEDGYSNVLSVVRVRN
jgi:hypothetical protein